MLLHPVLNHLDGSIDVALVEGDLEVAPRLGYLNRTLSHPPLSFSGGWQWISSDFFSNYFQVCTFVFRICLSSMIQRRATAKLGRGIQTDAVVNIVRLMLRFSPEGLINLNDVPKTFMHCFVPQLNNFENKVILLINSSRKDTVLVFIVVCSPPCMGRFLVQQVQMVLTERSTKTTIVIIKERVCTN